MDTKPPTILQCPSDIERIATSHGAGTVVRWTEPTATDYSNYTVSRSHTPGTVFGIGTTEVTYTFTDLSSNRNRATCTFAITIDQGSFSNTCINTAQSYDLIITNSGWHNSFFILP